MPETALRDSSSQTLNPATQLTTAFGWLMSALAGVSFLLVLGTLLRPGRLPGKAGWPEAALVVTATVATLSSLARQLPGQQVMLGASVIAIIGGFAHTLGATTAIPFGPFSFTESAGPSLLGLVAWPIPALWIIAILNSRGVARLILRPWSNRRAYGLWLIGVTAVLTVLFAMALDPFASQVKRYWLWQPTKFPLTWHGGPWVNFLGWLVTSLLILAFATPALINKQPRTSKTPPDYHPLFVWLLSVTLFTTGAFVHGLWPATGFGIVTGGLVAVLAARGARE